MGYQYPDAVDMLLPTYYSFSSNAHKAIVQHSTGGDMTVQAVYNTFKASMRSTHFAIGLDGTVAQFVPLERGAGGNCCPDGTHNAWWNSLIVQYPNLNLCTISIEHCNNSSQSLEMTQAQKDASNKLTLWLCEKYNLTTDAIHGHDSINTTNCPGSVFYNTYWQEMLNFVKQGEAPQVNQNQRTAFENEWKSVQPQARTDSGIAAMAWNDYQLGKFHGPAMTLEYPSVDWSGNPIVVQNVGNGRFEWRNGAGKFYAYA